MDSISTTSFFILILALSTSSSPVSNVTDNPPIALQTGNVTTPNQPLVNNRTIAPIQLPLVRPVSLSNLNLKKDNPVEEIYQGDECGKFGHCKKDEKCKNNMCVKCHDGEEGCQCKPYWGCWGNLECVKGKCVDTEKSSDYDGSPENGSEENFKCGKHRACKSDEKCKNNICVRCQDGEEGCRCRPYWGCKRNLKCIKGKCVDPEDRSEYDSSPERGRRDHFTCGKYKHCRRDEKCKNNMCVKCPEGEEGCHCKSHRTCKGNLKCIEGKCVEKRGSFERIESERDCDLTWEDARHECRRLDDDLITFSSEAQYRYVMELLDPEENYWWGCRWGKRSREFINADGKAIKKYPYSAWAGKEPKSGNERCCFIEGKTGKWRTSACDRKLCAICEKSHRESPESEESPESPENTSLRDSREYHESNERKSRYSSSDREDDDSSHEHLGRNIDVMDSESNERRDSEENKSIPESSGSKENLEPEDLEESEPSRESSGRNIYIVDSDDSLRHQGSKRNRSRFSSSDSEDPSIRENSGNIYIVGSRDLLEQQGCRYKGDCNEGEICKSWKCVSQKEKCREDQKQKNCPCNRSYECAKGLRCIGYRCDDHVDDCDGEDKGSVGCSCSYHDDCKSGLKCIGDVCSHVIRCQEDEDCERGEECKRGYCRTKQCSTAGCSCKHDSDCESHMTCYDKKCLSFKCSTLPRKEGCPCSAAEPCECDLTCGSDRVCREERSSCRRKPYGKKCPCRHDDDCRTGFKCSDDICTLDCDSRKGNIGCRCNRGKDCLSGSCISGKCCGKPEVEPSVCTPECKQGYTCRHGEGKQNECVSDGSCPTPELCDDTFDPVCSKIDGKVFLNTCRMKAYLCQKSVKSFPGYSSSCQSVCPLKIEGPKSTTAKILDLQETELHDGSVVSLTCQMGQMFSNGQTSLNYTCCACGIWEKIGAQNDQNLRCVADPCRYEDCHDTGYECEVTVSEDELTPLKAACICKEPKFVVSLPGKKPRCVDCKNHPEEGCPCRAETECCPKVKSPSGALVALCDLQTTCYKDSCKSCPARKADEGCPCHDIQDCAKGHTCNLRINRCMKCPSSSEPSPAGCPCQRGKCGHLAYCNHDTNNCEDCRTKPAEGCPCEAIFDCCKELGACGCNDGKCYFCTGKRRKFGCNCQQDSDCDNGLRCKLGTCTSDCEGKNKDIGCKCEKSTDCRFSLTCEDRICKAPAGECHRLYKPPGCPCKRDDYCAVGNECEKGYCRKISNPCDKIPKLDGCDCTEDNECKTNECRNAKCQAPSEVEPCRRSKYRPDGCHCSRDSQCESLECDYKQCKGKKNRCKEEVDRSDGCSCNRSSQCKSGTCKGGKCQRTEDSCSREFGRPDGCECYDDNECKSDHCSYGKCKRMDDPCQRELNKIEGCKCRDSRECQSGNCEKGHCRAETDECNGDYDKPSGCDCEYNHQCQGKNCHKGKCSNAFNPCSGKYDKPKGCYCEKGSECKSGKCEANSCKGEDGKCNDSSTCPSDSTCVKGECKACDYFGKRYDGCMCFKDKDCQSGKCEDYVCVTENGR